MKDKYDNNKAMIKDTYSMIHIALMLFNIMLKEAFSCNNINKEIFPYGYRTFDRVIDPDSLGFVDDALTYITHCTRDEFLETIKKAEALIDDTTFDMMKYCELYCNQDVNVLRIVSIIL